MDKILVIAVHPDDETLGCGGTLLKHKANNNEIHWLIATEMKESDGFKKKIIEKRKQEIQKVKELYQFSTVNQLGLSTMKVDEYSLSFLIDKIYNVINEIKPNIIFLPFKGDVHSDHRKIFEASYSCTKTFRNPELKKVYMMEVLSETEFAPNDGNSCFCPNTFIDISRFIDKKIDIIKVFESEIKEHPFPRSIENIRALATLRGATSNCSYAESFVLLKSIE